MMLYGEHIYRAIGNAFNERMMLSTELALLLLNDKLSLPIQDINNDYEMNQLKNDMEFKKLENFALNMEKMNSQMMNPDDVISEFKEDF
ncbi:hypothetical protein H477_6018 [[Clostridium] sordellii ATCC 9714]|nr:hypothetical protein H477_6018 [[Clostridium] sordellii ATCC 9714] [Paeniclostridium sordellii ATCC 9714]